VLLAVNLLAPTGAWSNNMYWLPQPALADLVRILLVYSGSLPFSLPLAVIFAIIASYGLFRLTWKQRFEAYLLLAWFLAPIAIPLVVSQLYRPMLLERYTIAASPAFYLLAAHGFESFTVKGFSKRYTQVLLATLIVLLSIASCFVYYNALTNERWREVVSYVDEHAKTGDMVLIYWPEGLLPFDYYSKRGNLDVQGFLAREGFTVTESNIDEVAAQGGTVVTEENITNLSHVVEGRDAVWLVIFWHGEEEKQLLTEEMTKLYGESTYHENYNVTDSNNKIMMHPHQSKIELFLFE